MFIASKGADLSLDIWRSRKALRGFFHNIFLMLKLYKDNPVIMIGAYGRIFL